MEPSEQPVEPTHYLIAFKDKSIYSAVAYWVDGDTIHYFTAGNTHNQASVSLIDRDLTTWQVAYYGANYDRLVDVKAAVAPDDLFRFRQGIRPR